MSIASTPHSDWFVAITARKEEVPAGRLCQQVQEACLKVNSKQRKAEHRDGERK